MIVRNSIYHFPSKVKRIYGFERSLSICVSEIVPTES